MQPPDQSSRACAFVFVACLGVSLRVVDAKTGYSEKGRREPVMVTA